MSRWIAIFLVAVSGAAISHAAITSDETQRLADAASVLGELANTPDRDLPEDLWNRAACVAVIPSVKKAAFIFGGEYGKGVMSCRIKGGWSPPAFLSLAKGSWGFQVGAEEVDVVLLVMNQRGLEKLLQDKVSLGAGASVAAGPIGRRAKAGTDLQMAAEILSYSRAQGLFAGIDLSGGVLQPDTDANRDTYGASVTPRALLIQGRGAVPQAASAFMAALARGLEPRKGR